MKHQHGMFLSSYVQTFVLFIVLDIEIKRNCSKVKRAFLSFFGFHSEMSHEVNLHKTDNHQSSPDKLQLRSSTFAVQMQDLHSLSTI